MAKSPAKAIAKNKSKVIAKAEEPSVKAIVLFSGGLDSRLVVKILREQGIETELLYFKLPFGCGANYSDNENFAKEHKVKLIIKDYTKYPLFEDYLEIIKHPKYGRGTGMNPCIDCKIFMFKKAKAYAEKQNPKIKIIATGEVLGERPMSQTSKAMGIIDREIGYELLRPLSAKLLKEKLVNREKFLDIQGRGRKTQLELARKFKIKFPNPSGGCLLCEKNYKNRLKDLLYEYKNKKLSPELLSTLESFRHFRNPETQGKIILARNESECILLENLNKSMQWNIFIPENFAGPTAIFQDSRDKSLAEEMVRAYSSKNLEERKKFDSFKL